jgi:hypothetical protein
LGLVVLVVQDLYRQLTEANSVFSTILLLVAVLVASGARNGAYWRFWWRWREVLAVQGSWWRTATKVIDGGIGVAGSVNSFPGGGGGGGAGAGW